MVTYFVDPIAGNNSNDGLSFANRKLTIPALSTGDTVKIIASEAATSTGLSGSWNGDGTTTQRRRIPYTGSVTKTVDSGNVAWTASANVTQSQQTGKTATNCQQFVIASGFTTGKVAYKALGATVDFSAYQQLSFHFAVTSGTLAANALKLCLCSDTTGDVIVDSFVIPYGLSADSVLFPITINKGSALGSSIQSIALYADSDPGSLTVRVGKSIACKAASSADALTLNSYVGKSTAGTGAEAWWPVRNLYDSTETDPADSTSGPMIEIEVYPSATISTRSRGYVGTTETATIYRRQPMVVPVANGASWWSSGTSSVTISGGWDRTNMSTQSDFTHMQSAGKGTFFNGTGSAPFIDKVGGSWCSTVVRVTADANIGDVDILCPESAGVDWAGFGVASGSISGSIRAVGGGVTTVSILPAGGPILSWNNIYAYSSADSGLTSNSAMVINHTGTIRLENNSSGGGTLASGRDFGTVVVKHNGSAGLTLTAQTNLLTIKNFTAMNNGTYGIRADGHGRVQLLSVTSSANTSGFAATTTSTFVSLRAECASIADSVPYDNGSLNKQYDTEVWLEGFASGAAKRGYFYGADISSEATDVDEGGGLAWRLKITNTNRTANFPARIGIELGDTMYKYVAANQQVTATVRAKKGNSTIKGFLGIRGGTLAGVSSDVRTEVTAVQASAGGFDTYTVQCTPTEAGFLEFYFEAYYNSGSLDTNSWVAFDTLDVTQ